MAKGRQPKGLRDIERRLGRAVGDIGDGADRGLVKSGLLVKKDSQKNSPAREGNLRASAYLVNKTGDKGAEGNFKGAGGPDVASLTRSEKQLAQGLSVAMDRGHKRNVVVGHGAGYAAKVHENQRAGAAGYKPELDTRKKSAKDVHSKVGGPKFLERALQTNQSTILRILAEESKV